MLVFWDEPPDVLYEWSKSAGQLADRIVAADGPFSLFPHDSVESPQECINALLQGAVESGAGLTRLEGREWAGQVEKRDAVIKACQDSEWVFWMDADERIRLCDLEHVHWALSNTRADAIITARYTPPNPDARWAPDSTTDEREDETFLHPRIFRSLDNMGVERCHWGYVATKNGKPVTYWAGMPNRVEVPQAAIGEEWLLFEHRQTWRSDQYRADQLEYRRRVALQVAQVGAEA